MGDVDPDPGVFTFCRRGMRNKTVFSHRLTGERCETHLDARASSNSRRLQVTSIPSLVNARKECSDRSVSDGTLGVPYQKATSKRHSAAACLVLDIESTAYRYAYYQILYPASRKKLAIPDANTYRSDLIAIICFRVIHGTVLQQPLSLTSQVKHC